MEKIIILCIKRFSSVKIFFESNYVMNLIKY